MTEATAPPRRERARRRRGRRGTPPRSPSRAPTASGGAATRPRPRRPRRPWPRRDFNRDRSGGATDATASRTRCAPAARRLSVEREEIQAAEASPEALEAGREILEQLLGHMGFDVTVTVESGDTSKLDVRGEEHEKEALGALIGRKGERLSALQHLVNLMLSRRLGDVDPRAGRRRGLPRPARAPAARDRDARRRTRKESGKMLQLEPMPALERRWIHLALREQPGRRDTVDRRGAASTRRDPPPGLTTYFRLRGKRVGWRPHEHPD